MDNTIMLILMALPLIGLQLVLMIINLVNLNKKAKTKYLSRGWWLVIILLGNLIGNIIYIVLENDSDKSKQSK